MPNVQINSISYINEIIKVLPKSSHIMKMGKLFLTDFNSNFPEICRYLCKLVQFDIMTELFKIDLSNKTKIFRSLVKIKSFVELVDFLGGNQAMAISMLLASQGLEKLRLKCNCESKGKKTKSKNTTTTRKKRTTTKP